ncbi:MAG: hypothetical protein BZY87_10150 [SAR202 cluster bacterium Io17-Chloro-G6]|nr:MAG: hypothetical protein BZY87_10150 [SAR202 cluster bacterium Io17-Chloro-G6]
MPLDIRAKSSPELRPGRIFAFTALVIALALAACGGGSSQVSPGGSGNLTSVDEVLAAARDSLSSVNSYRMETVMVAKNDVDGREISAGNINLTWSIPDRVQMIIVGADEGDEAEREEYISTDGRVMARRSAAGNFWVEYDRNGSPDDREARGILALVERFSAGPNFVPEMDEAELVGKIEIEGLTVYHVKGASTFRSEPPDDMPADVAAGFPRQQTDTAYDLYISVDDLLPRRLVSVVKISWETAAGDAPPSEPARMESTVDYLDYNAPVTIVLPKVG